jgi:hypothetical protein
MKIWTEIEIPISKIKTMLEENYEIEVDSPDGWVGVNFFIDKGIYEEYSLQLENNSESVLCNAEHLFETDNGWISALQLSKIEYANFLTKNGFERGAVRYTGNIIPIVDINVEHENHRYYTNGISSHNTGVGKSLAMCHFAASNLLDGKNVLYITMEMAEERIAERIDANLLDMSLDEIETVPKDSFMKKIDRVKKKTVGKLIIKEYPTSTAGAANFRHLLNELKLKKNFIPDIIYIDYLNICASSRVKYTASVNSYTYVKAIAEEFRGLAVEHDLPIVTATQTTRSGYASSDVVLTDVSESFGLPATADLMFALISNEQLESFNQIMVKQLKNRYSDLSKNRRFVIGIDRSKMKLYDVDQTEQENIQDDIPIMDKTEYGQRDNEFFQNRSKFSKKFEGFA